ncbi:hypothetical protein DSM19430T_29840 [Desulfovibrio psychrotolerans]|uniref:Uncharacterized protein n=1 Tax=Desulfovibrio psychrotolerans TaxID=415242 RepID=A0A7J0BX65_9BACT|nr:hypothetical protein DSM19430T_29840 [Desulfovibrio psychrotolerans]
MANGCQFSPPNPQAIGATSWEVARQWRERHPNMRPCPKTAPPWWWIERTKCAKCEHREQEEETCTRPNISESKN